MPNIPDGLPGGFQPQRDGDRRNRGDPRCTATTLVVEPKAPQRKGTLSDFLEKLDTIYPKLATCKFSWVEGPKGQVMEQPLRKPLALSVGDWKRLEN